MTVLSETGPQGALGVCLGVQHIMLDRLWGPQCLQFCPSPGLRTEDADKEVELLQPGPRIASYEEPNLAGYWVDPSESALQTPARWGGPAHSSLAGTKTIFKNFLKTQTVQFRNGLTKYTQNSQNKRSFIQGSG